MKLLPFIFLAILFHACSKDSKTKRLIVGNWKVDVVRIEDGEGFLFYDSLANGMFQLSTDHISGQTKYQYDYFSQYLVQDSVAFNHATYILDAKGEEFLIVRATDTLRTKIIMLTKKSFTFEYYDQLAFRLKRFTCSRM
ncbi:MAG: hypothetical protein ACKOWW_06630 [Flavobacteriales bacterium]